MYLLKHVMHDMGRASTTHSFPDTVPGRRALLQMGLGLPELWEIGYHVQCCVMVLW